MTPERLAIARRLAACPRWVFLAGMLRLSVYVDGAVFDAVRQAEPWPPGRSHGGGDVAWVPDLADPLTAAGVLVVVRRAWGDPRASANLVYDARSVPSPFLWQVLIRDCDRLRAEFLAATEIEALCAALEAAP